jgi:hypothetical protein
MDLSAQIYTSLDVLPTSIAKVVHGATQVDGQPYIPFFCANCGCDGGWVHESSKDFAFYLCSPCFSKHGAVAGTMAIPDEVFWARVKAAQLEEFGRELLPHEVVEALKDSDNILSKLARDRYGLPEYAEAKRR